MSMTTLRSSIAATRDVTYLNTGWSGPSPEPVLARIRELLDKEASVGPASLEGQRLAREANQEAVAAAAVMFKADTNEVMLTHGTTEGVHIVLYGVEWQPGDELVTCNLEHPAIGSPTAVLEERFGVTVRRVAVPAAATADESFDLITAAINDKTRVVALSHVQYSCGLKLPVRRIADVAHSHGAIMLVDGAQTGGQLDLDVRALGADFYAISGQKWLLGPQATGAFYAAKEHQRSINPLFSTHLIADSRAPMLENVTPNLMSRFRTASQSPALAAGFAAAANLLQEIGMAEVEARAMELADRMRMGVSDVAGADLTGPTRREDACGLVAVTLDGWKPGQIVSSLWERWRIAGRAVGFPEAVRFSFHVFNDESDVDRALMALKTLAAETPPEPAPAH